MVQQIDEVNKGDVVNGVAVADVAVELTPEQTKERMLELFIAGKRHYLEDQFEEAADTLEQAVQLADKVFGSKTPETFDYYLYYGKTLLEVGRLENAVLQSGGDQQDDEEDGEESVSEEPTPNADGELEPVVEEANESKEEDAIGEPTDGDDNKEVDDTQEEPIQAAWEIFEHCRLICENQEPSAEWDLHKADVLMFLGDCSAENNNFDQAIEDLCKSQELKEKHGCSGRKLADVVFELARVYKLAEKFGLAHENYTKAKKILEEQIAEIEKSPTPEEFAKELEDLRSIVEDLQLQIEDAVESAKQLNECKKTEGSAPKTTITKIPAAPVDGKLGTAIEVRKAPTKRPASSDPSEDVENVEAKKVKEMGEDEKMVTTESTEIGTQSNGNLTTA